MPDINKIKRLGQDRQDLIDRLLNDFQKRVVQLQDWLMEGFFDDFVQRVTADGRIRQGERYIAKVNTSPFWKSFYQKSLDVAVWIINQIPVVGKMLTGYFNELTGRNTDSETKTISELFLNRLGYDGKQIVKGGFFDLLINDRTAERRVKRLGIQAIVAGKDIKTFKSDLKAVIQGDKAANRPGVVEGHYYTNANTVFAEYDRTVSEVQADKYELTHAIWSGPKLTTSRPFCISKKGKVFSLEQLQAMDNQTWKGKIPGQSTLVSAGGYNCVDILLWITAGMAQELGWSGK